MVYKYNKEKLLFEKTYKLLKYKIFTFILLIALAGTLISSVKLKNNSDELKEIIKQKEQRIALIKQPLREETYIKDLYKNIGFKLNDEQAEKFERLALKYRDQIEEAKVPATLVWWIAFKESRFNPEATNGESSAKGQFQFLDGTWNAMCKLKGVGRGGRFNEEKQVEILLTYLNYLYRKHGDWGKSMHEYHGGEYQYPMSFLFK